MATPLWLLLLAPLPFQTVRPPVESVRLNGPLAQGTVGGWSGAPVLSPDGSLVLFDRQIHRLSVDGELFVRPVDASAPPTLLDTGLVLLKAFSPDGTRVVYVKRLGDHFGGLWSVPSDGSSAPIALIPDDPSLLVADLSRGRQALAFSDDSAHVALRLTIGGTTELYGVPVAGGSLVRLNDPLGSGGLVVELIGAAGNDIVYVADQDGDQHYDVHAVPADGSGPVRTLSLLPGGQSAAWFPPYLPTIAPGGEHVLFHAMSGNSILGLHSVRLDAGAPPVALTDVFTSYRVTPDGATVVHYRRAGAGRQHVSSVPIDGSAPATVLASVSTGTVAYLGLSPDGQRLLAVNEGGPTELVTTAIDGGDDATLAGFELDPSRPPQFSRDSARIAFKTSNGIYALASDQSSAPLHVVPFGVFTTVEGFALTEEAVVVHGNLESSDAELFVASLSVAGTLRRLNANLPTGQEVQTFVLTTDGEFALADYSLLSAELTEGPTALFRLALDFPETLELNPPFPLEVTGSVRAYRTGGGRALYLADQDTARTVELYSVPVRGGASVRLNADLVPFGDVIDFRLSRDGRQAVFLADAEVNERFDLYGVPTDGSLPPVRLNADLGPREIDAFELSPDGAQVVYLDSRSTPRLYRVASTGGTVSTLTFAGGPFEFTADSTRVLFRTQVGRLSSVALAGGPVADLTGGRTVKAYRVSADGTRVVTLALDGATERLYSIPIDGGASVALHATPVAGGNVTDFALSGTRVVFRGDLLTDERFLLLSAPIDCSSPAVVLNTPMTAGGDVRAFAVLAQGTHGAYVADAQVDEEFGLYGVPLIGGASVHLANLTDFIPDGVLRLVRGGRRVLFQDGLQLDSVPIRGGAATLVHTFAPPTPAFELSSDGERLVFQDSFGIRTRPISGGPITVLATPVQPAVARGFQQDGAAVVYLDQANGLNELHASHYRPRARQDGSPRDAR